MSQGSIRIGISGWRYEPWRSKFYPEGLAQRRELEYASRQLSTPEARKFASGFIYARLHGDKKIYVSGYTDEALNTWAKKIRAWTNGKDAPKADVFKPAHKRQRRDVFVYLDNDVKVRAPVDARSLLDRLGVEIPPVPAERWKKAGRSV